MTHQMDLFPETLYTHHGEGGEAASPKRERCGVTELRRWVLFSLKPEPYRAVLSGTKKTEYRRGVFLKSQANAFVYCSSPVMEVGAFVRLGVPHIAPIDEIAAHAEAEKKGAGKVMKKWLKGRDEGSALPILSVQTFPPLSLEDIRTHFPYFHPPQQLIYLDKYLALLSFLKGRRGIFPPSVP